MSTSNPRSSVVVMAIPTKKLADGFSIPVYGFGTWQMGGLTSVDPNNDDVADIAGIRAAIEAGVTHIDTAEIYAAGHAEELVAAAITGVDRSSLFIASKAQTSHARPEDVIAACYGSLTRLNTDYIDLYMPHTHNPTVPIDETMSAFDQLVDEGLVKYIGVSNYSTESLDIARKSSRHPVVVNQVYYSIAAREPETEGLLEYCQANDVILNAYRPLEKGVLLTSGAGLLTELATKYSKSPAQICINWLISQPNVVTLAKTRNPAHLAENLGALDWVMDQADIELLRAEDQSALAGDARLG